MALDFIAGCFGGCAGILVGHPLDTVKIRIQTQDFRNPVYKGTIDCFRNVVKQESVKGLYKGMSSPLAGVAVINAIVFGVYGNVQKQFSDPQSLKSYFLSGAIAGIVQSFICSPMELIKSRIQIQQKKVSHGPLQCMAKIYGTEGLRGIFKGLNITFMRESLGFGVYFSTYEWLTRSDDPTPISTAYMLMAGGSAGAASWLCTYPLDVIKSRVQVDGVNGRRQYRNSIDCLVKSTRAEGFRFLFRGLSPTLIRAFPTNAATWAVVTWTMRAFERVESPQSSAARSDIIEAKFWDDFSYGIIHSYYDFGLMYNFYLKCPTDNST